MNSGGNEAGEMRHIHEELGAAFVGRFAQRLEVEFARVGAMAADHQLRLMHACEPANLIVVDALVFLAHAVGHHFEESAREIHRASVRQVTAMREVHRQNRIARLELREIHGHIGLRARMRLHIGEVRAKQFLGAIDGDLLDYVDVFATAVVACPRQALGVFVGQDGALRLQYRAADGILRRDLFKVVLLPLRLSFDGGRNFGHLAYQVEDIYGLCQHLQENGVTINRPPRDGRMAFVRSPDGISVELLQKGDPLPIREPWASMGNTGSW